MSDRLIIVGITGVARSGKDTIAGILCQRFGFTRIALADGVRSAFRDMDGPTWELTKQLEACGKSSRWALQQLGTEARWKANAHGVWLYLAHTKIRYLAYIHPEPRARFVIPDIRFEAERDYFRLMLGERFRLWKVLRTGAGLSGEAAIHPSETGVATMRADLLIPNDGTAADLERVVSIYATQLAEAP